MRYPIIFIFMLVLPVSVFAQKDTLIFKNKTVVIGEVLKIQLGVITFDPDDANDITVQLRKLESIHAGMRNFRIETVDHQVLYGKILHSYKSGFVNVFYGTDSASVALNNISNCYPIENSFWKRINGTAGAGYSYTRSSELGRLNLDLNARYSSEKTEYSTTISAITTVDHSEYSRDNEDASFGINYYYHPKWFAAGAVSYQRNIELGISSRFQEGIGMGNKLLLTKYLQLLAFSGLVFNEENSLEGVYSGVLNEVMVGCKLNVFRFEKPELDIQTTQYGFFSLSQERVRYAGDLGITWEMVEDVDLKLSFYTDYDSKPPGAESANIDYGTVISIAIEF